MTSAFLMLITAAIGAGIIYLIMVFLQFLFHSAICSGCSLALFEINNASPTDFELFAMAALMAVIAISLFRAFKAWREATERLGIA